MPHYYQVDCCTNLLVLAQQLGQFRDPTRCYIVDMCAIPKENIKREDSISRDEFSQGMVNQSFVKEIYGDPVACYYDSKGDLDPHLTQQKMTSIDKKCDEVIQPNIAGCVCSISQKEPLDDVIASAVIFSTHNSVSSRYMERLLKNYNTKCSTWFSHDTQSAGNGRFSLRESKMTHITQCGGDAPPRRDNARILSIMPLDGLPTTRDNVSDLYISSKYMENSVALHCININKCLVKHQSLSAVCKVKNMFDLCCYTKQLDSYIRYAGLVSSVMKQYVSQIVKAAVRKHLSNNVNLTVINDYLCLTDIKTVYDYVTNPFHIQSKLRSFVERNYQLFELLQHIVNEERVNEPPWKRVLWISFSRRLIKFLNDNFGLTDSKLKSLYSALNIGAKETSSLLDTGRVFQACTTDVKEKSELAKLISIKDQIGKAPGLFKLITREGNSVNKLADLITTSTTDFSNQLPALIVQQSTSIENPTRFSLPKLLCYPLKMTDDKTPPAKAEEKVEQASATTTNVEEEEAKKLTQDLKSYCDEQCKSMFEGASEEEIEKLSKLAHQGCVKTSVETQTFTHNMIIKGAREKSLGRPLTDDFKAGVNQACSTISEPTTSNTESLAKRVIDNNIRVMKRTRDIMAQTNQGDSLTQGSTKKHKGRLTLARLLDYSRKLNDSDGDLELGTVSQGSTTTTDSAGKVDKTTEQQGSTGSTENVVKYLDFLEKLE